MRLYEHKIPQKLYRNMRESLWPCRWMRQMIYWGQSRWGSHLLLKLGNSAWQLEILLVLIIPSQLESLVDSTVTFLVRPASQSVVESKPMQLSIPGIGKSKIRPKIKLYSRKFPNSHIHFFIIPLFCSWMCYQYSTIYINFDIKELNISCIFLTVEVLYLIRKGI